MRNEPGAPAQDPRSAVDAVEFWWHSIDVGGGVVTPGRKTPELLAQELRSMRLPDLRGKTVLDVGAWDGFFSFAAEERGASSVTALDHFVWSIDLPAQQREWERCKREGVAPAPYEKTPYWQPEKLPGKRGFDTAHALRQSRVRAIVADLMTADLAALGQFDVVFYLGVLYHMESPLEAMKRVAAATRELAVIETEAVQFPGLEGRALCEFFPTNELNGDVSNWWAPNAKALEGLCIAAGFDRVEIVQGMPEPTVPRAWPLLHGDAPRRYRAVAHAWKGPAR